ncbi:MAG TPA: radical SAM protein [Candidatus Paceibacterota bacterium]|nr:radical SAM protein [Candidatus Paceibacterota bacterium]
MVSYKQIMKNALKKRPHRAIKSVFSTIRHGPKASLPFKLKMECSSICNLKCIMCPLHVGLKRKQGFLTFDNFKNVFDQIKPAYLNLTGIGEPFLNKELFKIVEYAKKEGTMVKLDTNATLLTQENIEKILKTGIDYISISIDGVDKKSYEKIRIGSNFELVKDNVKNLTKERDRLKSKTHVHMFFVLQEDNILYLPEFIKLAEELGVNYVAGSFVVTLGGNNNAKNKISLYREELQKVIEETKELIKKAKVEVSVQPLLDFLEEKEEKREYNKNKPCLMPWYSTFITWDGWVNPCDFSCDNEEVFGNAFEEPFKNIWNNKKYKDFRLNLLKNRESINLCRGCGVDESYIIQEIKKIPFGKSIGYKIKDEGEKN